MKYSICFSILFTIPYLSNTVVFAACSNTMPSAGETVTCTGSSSTEINLSGQDNVTVNIENGANLTATASSNTIDVFNAENFILNNNGTVSNATAGSTTIDINFSSDNSIITNNGTISNTGGGFSSAIVINTNNATITNNGAINISGDDIRQAIYVPFKDDFQLINNGTISHSPGGASDIIIILGDGGNINNSGTIIGTYNNSLSIVDYYTGISMLGENYEINNSGNIEIVSDLGEGIKLTGNSVRLINSGTISVSDYTSSPGVSFSRYAVNASSFFGEVLTITNTSTGEISIDENSTAILGEGGMKM
ncbi:hypothetical protein [Zooshikella ganghwensis]|uniref:Autotransporter outer membrane beta-barrel domain-containing protein n=1 Tax=Zooshikella ganghwensis TaxID=202772 RepID=A0A4P9VHT5_9GAMM|nr:hypothetical protein [Zooshikella ganghwensis]RDH41934.1 hypothetical protein B9G39_26335 [Zooshikella ganghwensis]